MLKIIHRLEISAPETIYDQVAGFFSLEVPFGWQETSLPTGETVFTIHCEDREFLEKLANTCKDTHPEMDVKLSTIENRDWQGAWRDFFTPVLCGSRFVVLPPWLANEDFGKRQKIVIEPKSAFGTGHHASTRLCLLALSGLLDKGEIHPGQAFLDLGCGSGVLAIAAAKSGLSGRALDLDSLAVANTRENLEINNLQNVRVACGSIADIGEQKFDLILANILAQPLIELAPLIVAALEPRGCLVLSGILDSQAQKVSAAYQASGLGEPEILAEDEWRALVWS